MKMRTVIFICAVLACINAKAIESNRPEEIDDAIDAFYSSIYKIFEFCKEPNSDAGIEIQTNAESTRRTFHSAKIKFSGFSTEEIDGKKEVEKMAPVIEWVDQCYREIGAENDCQICLENCEKKKDLNAAFECKHVAQRHVANEKTLAGHKDPGL